MHDRKDFKMEHTNRNVLWLTMDHVTFHHSTNTLGARPVLDTDERLCRERVSFTSCEDI